MPQREFFAQQHATSWSAAVLLDPTRVNQPSSLTFKVHDQAGGLMESASMQVPANVLHEAVSGLLHDCWDAWLFGDPGAMRQALKAVGTQWRRESRRRPIW